MRLPRLLVILLFLCLQSTYSKVGSEETARTSSFVMKTLQDSIAWADYFYNVHRYERAILLYEKSLNLEGVDTSHVLKKLALSEAAMENPDASVSHIYTYFEEDFNPSFLLHEGFDEIRTTPKFKELSTALIPKINTWSVVYFVVALIGFYVIVTVLINKKINRVASLLIAGFIFIHSFFILNIAMFRANYIFEYPHSYLMSTWASFLYGPLLYFYFKRITQKYSFKSLDLLHLLPTVLLLGFMLPEIYLLSAEQKISLMFSRMQNGLPHQDAGRLLVIVLLKTISLGAYGFFIRKVYKSAKEKFDFDRKSRVWQKNIYQIHISYVLTYGIYGLLIINSQSSGIIYHASLASMALMVLYVGYSANIQPQVFSGAYSYVNRLFPKYEKSGLTESLSQELKDSLECLFVDEKIYKENDLNLDTVAQRLDTTRHNASQVINEHFKMSFHELVNKYRIEEAKRMLDEDSKRNWNIIDVAYEVGYNNKVTFNKAFKKDTKLTPTEFQRRRQQTA